MNKCRGAQAFRGSDTKLEHRGKQKYTLFKQANLQRTLEQTALDYH